MVSRDPGNAMHEYVHRVSGEGRKDQYADEYFGQEYGSAAPADLP